MTKRFPPTSCTKRQSRQERQYGLTKYSKMNTFPDTLPDSRRWLRKRFPDSAAQSFEEDPMDIRQKLSLVTASVLPVLAISAYLLFAPARVNASSCPSGDISVPTCGPGGNGCLSGSSCLEIGEIGIQPECGKLDPAGQCVAPGCMKCEPQ